MCRKRKIKDIKIENMVYNESDNKIIGLDKTDKKWYHITNRLVTNQGDILNNKIIFDDNYNGNIEKNIKSIELDRREKNTTKKQKNNNKFDVKEYIRNNVLNGKSQCFCVTDKSKSEFTKKDVDTYREQQLIFQGEMIYGSSAPAIDPVDKMNIINMEGGIKGNGQSIADIYDNIVRNN
jgi:hypothetical protein